MRWTPGKSNIIADALSRAPIFNPEEEELTTSSTIQCLAASEELKMFTSHECEQYKLLRAYVQNSNYPIANDITVPYKKIWKRLSVADNGLITLDYSKIGLPVGLRKTILKMIHTQHKGETWIK